jgi:hypothetical protein
VSELLFEIESEDEELTNVFRVSFYGEEHYVIEQEDEALHTIILSRDETYDLIDGLKDALGDTK